MWSVSNKKLCLAKLVISLEKIQIKQRDENKDVEAEDKKNTKGNTMRYRDFKNKDMYLIIVAYSEVNRYKIRVRRALDMKTKR